MRINKQINLIKCSVFVFFASALCNTSSICNLNLAHVSSQIGRSTENPIDFVVTDTVPGGQSQVDGQTVQSTISRFACRIICQRNPPYSARIYAAGFDSSKNIFLGVGCPDVHIHHSV